MEQNKYEDYKREAKYLMSTLKKMEQKIDNYGDEHKETPSMQRLHEVSNLMEELGVETSINMDIIIMALEYFSITEHPAVLYERKELYKYLYTLYYKDFSECLKKHQATYDDIYCNCDTYKKNYECTGCVKGMSQKCERLNLLRQIDEQRKDIEQKIGSHAVISLPQILSVFRNYLLRENVDMSELEFDYDKKIKNNGNK